MSTAQDLRYLFDTDFAAPATRPVAAPEEAFEPNVDEKRVAAENARAAAIAAADQAGYERGLEEATTRAAGREEARLNLLLERLDAQFGAVAADVEARMTRLEGAAAELGVGAARKLAPALLAQASQTEVAAFFAGAMREFIEAPRLDLRLAPEDEAKAGPIIRKLAQAGGYEGDIRLRSDESLSPGDCVVGWGDGGVKRDFKAIDEKLEAMLAEYFGPERDDEAGEK